MNSNGFAYSQSWIVNSDYCRDSNEEFKRRGDLLTYDPSIIRKSAVTVNVSVVSGSSSESLLKAILVIQKYNSCGKMLFGLNCADYFRILDEFCVYIKYVSTAQWLGFRFMLRSLSVSTEDVTILIDKLIDKLLVNECESSDVIGLSKLIVSVITKKTNKLKLLDTIAYVSFDVSLDEGLSTNQEFMLINNIESFVRDARKGVSCGDLFDELYNKGLHCKSIHVYGGVSHFIYNYTSVPYVLCDHVIKLVHASDGLCTYIRPPSTYCFDDNGVLCVSPEQFECANTLYDKHKRHFREFLKMYTNYVNPMFDTFFAQSVAGVRDSIGRLVGSQVPVDHHDSSKMLVMWLCVGCESEKPERYDACVLKDIGAFISSKKRESSASISSKKRESSSSISSKKHERSILSVPDFPNSKRGRLALSIHTFICQFREMHSLKGIFISCDPLLDICNINKVNIRNNVCNFFHHVKHTNTFSVIERRMGLLYSKVSYCTSERDRSREENELVRLCSKNLRRFIIEYVCHVSPSVDHQFARAFAGLKYDKRKVIDLVSAEDAGVVPVRAKYVLQDRPSVSVFTPCVESVSSSSYVFPFI